MAAAAPPVALLQLKVEAGNYSNNDSDNSSSNRVPMRTGGTPKNPSLPYLSLTKPTWVVRTESNVRKEIRKKPDPPCVVCKGTGRVDCHHCSGKGRTNYVHLAMLSKGHWPKWCRTCGSGLGYSSRCLGTGEYRYIMGFHFMKTDSDDTHEYQSRSQSNSELHSAAHQLRDGEHLNLNLADEDESNSSIVHFDPKHFFNYSMLQNYACLSACLTFLFTNGLFN